MALTPRGKALRHLSTHRGLTEQPAGSNTDKRPTRLDGRPGIRGIREAQIATGGGGTWLVGTPWCGEWAFWALERAGVNGITSRIASVALIEDDARARRAPFAGWNARDGWRSVLRGDLVVLFGRGVHVEVVRSFKAGLVITEGGNTSSDDGGSQSNGGGSYRRERPLSHVYGFARVNYPGGPRLVDRLAMRTERSRPAPPNERVVVTPSHDLMLVGRLTMSDDPHARELARRVERALA